MTPLDAAAVAELVRSGLLQPGAPDLESVEWTYARWKPATSLSAGYELRFADGSRRQLVVKRYAGDKARLIAERRRGPDEAACDPLLRAELARPEEGLRAWVFPSDRVLPGLGRLLDLRRTARWLNGTELFGGARMRAHRSAATLLRYRPESRAVFRLSAGWKSADGRRGRTDLAVRVLPPDRAGHVVMQRQACAFDGSPRLLAAQPRTGLLAEEWLDVRPLPGDGFDHAALVGGLLASLHARPRAPGAAARRAPGPGPSPLFAWNSELAALDATLQVRLPADEPVWSHGDLHADQVALESGTGRPRLLDLDRLALAPAAADLASWIADHLAVSPELGLERAAAPLLDGYAAAGGRPPSGSILALHVVAELRSRAAGSLRRLEQGAVGRARRLLELALSMRERESSPTGDRA